MGDSMLTTKSGTPTCMRPRRIYCRKSRKRAPIYPGRAVVTLLTGLLIVACAALSGCQSLSRNASAQPSTLTDTYWKLTRVGGHDVRTRSGTREPYLLLTRRKQRVEGFAGCNNISGRYRIQDSHLHFESVAGTRMYCKGRMALEQAYTQALSETTHTRIVGHRLTLLGADNRPLATFRARLTH